MTRLLLSGSLSCFVLAVGGVTTWVQSQNFELAGRLDALQRESESLTRRASALSDGIARFEFEFIARSEERPNETEGEGR